MVRPLLPDALALTFALPDSALNNNAKDEVLDALNDNFKARMKHTSTLGSTQSVKTSQLIKLRLLQCLTCLKAMRTLKRTTLTQPMLVSK